VRTDTLTDRQTDRQKWKQYIRRFHSVHGGCNKRTQFVTIVSVLGINLSIELKFPTETKTR